MKKLLRFIPILIVVVFVTASIGGWFWRLPIPQQLGTGINGAEAQAQIAGPIVAPYGVRNGCAGKANLASGFAEVVADCLQNFNFGPMCQEVGLNGAATPVLGDVVKCYATATVTQFPTGSAPTATHSAVVINAATANATATVQWFAVQ